MAIIVASFDPSSGTSGQFNNTLPNSGIGTLVVYNDSGITIDTMWAGESKVLPAGMIDIIKVCKPADIISWQQDYILNNVSSWPASVVKVVGYRPDEELPYSAFPVPLQRTSNVGNSVPIATSATSVVNDGNTAPTQVVEGTPSGAGSSQLKWNNDGSGIIGGGHVNVNNAGAITGASLDGSEITTGTVAGARIGGPLAEGTVIGSVTKGLSIDNLGGGTSGDAGIMTNVNAASLNGPTAWLKTNNYWDGSNDRYITTNFAAQLQHNPGDTCPRFRPAASGTAGQVITWQGYTHVAGGSAFSGTGAGTVSHGLNQTPSFVGITMNVSNSTMTVGVDSIGLTNVHVNVGSPGFAWVGMAFIAQ